jgi:Iap family predicted aminopeptidase
MFTRILALIWITAATQAQTIEFKRLNAGVLEEWLRLAHPKVAERYQRLRRLFLETGCTGLVEQKVRGSKEPNLICAVAGSGESANKILVGAHFDAAGGDGVIDNWTGAILLPSLAAFMREAPKRHSFEFVGFAAEEKGLLGSRDYLRAIKTEDRKRIAAVITMDSLGLTSTKVWVSSSSKELIEHGVRVANSMNLGFAGVDVDAVGTTDSMTFHQSRIPTLSLHSLTQETWEVVNSRRDVWAALSWQDYYDTHRFVSALLLS